MSEPYDDRCIVTDEPSTAELVEHWEGCAGAEATINDWRQRAEKAEAALVKAKDNAAFSLERRDVAEARLAELVREAYAALNDMEKAESTFAARLASRRFRNILAKYEGGEHG